MKHIENFDKFNESWLGDKLEKWFPVYKEKEIYTEIASHIFERIKEIFDMNNLTGNNTGSKLTYKLEETDSDLGYITIYFHYDDGDLIFKIDEKEINCNTKLKDNIYKFLFKKFKEKEKAEKLKDLLKLKDKYTR